MMIRLAMIVALGTLAVTYSPQPVAASGTSDVPRLMICAGTPVIKPKTMHWCTSMCSSYMTNIVRKSWSAGGATGFGTLMTNDGVPNCGQGTWTKHPGSVVILGNATMRTYCGENGQPATAFLFTSTNLWDGASLPQLQC